MRGPTQRRVLAAVALVMGLALPAAAPGATAEGTTLERVREAYAALERYDRPAARRVLAELETDGAAGDEVVLARAWLAHMDGDYAAVLELLEQVELADDPQVEDLRRTAAAAARWMGDAREKRSAHFVVRYPAGVEELMAEPALEVLEAAYEAVGHDLGLYPEEPVLVEIYPSSSAFAEASGLPLRAMANDTVALCRWDRLLVTSPMAAAFGYPWADTLCHEYAHLVVNRLGGGQVPVWMHEGIAAFEQRRWRGETGLVLDPYQQAALTRALEQDALVALEAIGNCLACLDDKEQVRLAFAEVQTMVDYLVRARGMQALRDAIASCGNGADAQDAVGAAHGGGFEAFEQGWREYVQGRGWFEDENIGVIALGLDDPAADAEAAAGEDSLLAQHPGGAGHARLGDLLLDRGQRRAALLEYERAEALLPVHSPSLACKKAYAHRELGEHLEALQVLEPAFERYPDYEPLAVNLAWAHVALGQPDQALEKLRWAAWINPFDPRIYEGQLALLDPERDRAQWQRARDALDTLGRHLSYDGSQRDPPRDAPEGD